MRNMGNYVGFDKSNPTNKSMQSPPFMGGVGNVVCLVQNGNGIVKLVEKMNI
jgi:hypothetical protein